MQDTRQQIMTILKERGRSTVEELSAALGLTAATVRHHLDILHQAGLVEMPETRRRTTPGRPQHIYILTEAAARHFPQNYAGLASAMLDQIQERLPSAEYEAFLDSIAEQMAGEFAPVPFTESFETRLGRAVDFLNAKGFMARYTQENNQYALQITNCPYRDVMRTHAQICKIDLALITRLLSVTPHRTTRMAGGDNLCTFHFSAPA